MILILILVDLFHLLFGKILYFVYFVALLVNMVKLEALLLLRTRYVKVK